MVRIPQFEESHREAICDVLGATGGGLTGSEIGRLLQRCKISDPHPGITKLHRLFAALGARQEQDGCGNNVAAFIQTAMKPVAYVDNPDSFEYRREKLNKVLSFCGMTLKEDGKLRRSAVVRTITEAEERAGRLRAELKRRNVHPDVLRFCKAELLHKNYFHAVFEATKSVADKIRQKTGLSSDGAELVDQAFGISTNGYPLLAFNSLQTQTERGEHRGLMNLLKGMFGTFRNVTAHAPKISWSINEQDALDLLTLASLLHRRLDNAVRTVIS